MALISIDRRRLGKYLLIAVPVLGLALSAGDAESPFKSTAEPPFIHTGDLDEVQKRGQLRILYPLEPGPENLPRPGSLLRSELELAREFALRRGLVPVLVHVPSREALLPALVAGQGDLVAGNLERASRPKPRVAFTVPVGVVRLQVVTRANDALLQDPSDLAGRRLVVRADSTQQARVEALRDAEPALIVEEVDSSSDDEELIDAVARGTHDLAVAESELVEACLRYRGDVRVAFPLPAGPPTVWAVRPQSTALLAALNRFLDEHHLTSPSVDARFDDLRRIREQRVLRVVTRPGYASYFMWRGRVMGFQHDLASEFARREGLRLEIVVPRDGEHPIDLLRAGRGDLVAAAYSATPARLSAGGLLFSDPYAWTSEVVVTRATDRVLAGPHGLAGRTVHVRRGSAQWERLERLQRAGIDVRVEAVPELLPTEESIARVASGQYDLTVAEDHVLDVELSWRNDVRAAFALEEWVPLSWVTRSTNPELMAAVNRFVAEARRNGFLASAHEQYFEHAARIRSRVRGRAPAPGTLSPYDALARRYAERYGFDWRLIVAQMYEESGFDPQAVSFAGARGLMQMLPATAASLGFENPNDPEQAIHAGVRYMDLLRERFESELAVADRLWFTLAAYNAGYGRVRSARRLAAERGLDPDRWFDHVEVAMTWLSAPPAAAGEEPVELTDGQCRCTQTVAYVREVRDRYNAYVSAL